MLMLILILICVDADVDVEVDVDVDVDHFVQDPVHLFRRVPAFLRFLKHRVLQAALAHLDVLVHQHPEVLVLGDQPPHVLQRLVVPCLQVDNLSLETFMKPSNVNLDAFAIILQYSSVKQGVAYEKG